MSNILWTINVHRAINKETARVLLTLSAKDSKKWSNNMEKKSVVHFFLVLLLVAGVPLQFLHDLLSHYSLCVRWWFHDNLYVRCYFRTWDKLQIQWLPKCNLLLTECINISYIFLYRPARCKNCGCILPRYTPARPLPTARKFTSLPWDFPVLALSQLNFVSVVSPRA